MVRMRTPTVLYHVAVHLKHSHVLICLSKWALVIRPSVCVWMCVDACVLSHQVLGHAA